MGDKVRRARRWRRPACRCCPAPGVLETTQQAEEAAERIGFPVILKARAGGGGRGMKIVESKDAARRRVADGAQRGAGRRSATPTSTWSGTRRGRATSRSRSLGDQHGQSHLGERECSIQRRHQKVIEEAPRAALPDERAPKLRGVARKAIESDRLHRRRHDRVPARQGRQLLLHGDEHAHPGRAPGDRDGARRRPRARADPDRGRRAARSSSHGHHARAATRSSAASTPRTRTPSRPSPGRITALHLPGGLGVRVDTHVYAGYVVPPNYDSLLAKVIVRAENRPAALARLRRALAEFVVEGIQDQHRLFPAPPGKQGLHRRQAGHAPHRTRC